MNICMRKVGSFRALLMVPVLVAIGFARGEGTGLSTILDSALIKTSGEPEYGRFYGYRTNTEGPGYDAFALAKAKAQADGVPLVAIFAEEGCSHCAGFAANMNEGQDALLEWMTKTKAVITYFKGNVSGVYPYNIVVAPPAASEAYAFIQECGLTPGFYAYPVYGVAYTTNGVTKKVFGTLAYDTWTTGSFAAWDVNQFKNYLTGIFSTWTDGAGFPLDWDEVNITPGDADFGCGTTETARLEAMPSTRFVNVPLVKSSNLGTVTTNRLEAAYPDNTTFTTNIVWPAAADQAKQIREVPLDMGGHHSADNIVSLKLYDSEGTLNATNLIACVAEAEPSHHFPLWLGERFDFGEWTFDFDAATNKVRLAAAAGTNAYTLVVVGGGLWCPDCISCERDLTEDPRFAEWARANNIALVVSDQPQKDTTASSMVTHDVGRRGTSGSYYLSRKGLSIAEGTAQFTAMTNRSYNIWKTDPGALRLSNPTFLLFRPDGTIAGRLVGETNMSRVKASGVSQNSEAFDFAENMARLADLLRLAGDTSEEGNNRPDAKAVEAYAYGATNTCSLQVADTADVFKFTGIPAGDTFRICLDSSQGAKSKPEVRLLALTDAAGGVYGELPPLEQGDGVWRLTRAQVSGGVFLEVSAFSDARYAIYGGDTEMTVTFHTEAIPPDPGVVGFAADAIEASEGAGAATLTLERTRGSSGEVKVRIELDGAATTAPEGSYTWDAGDEAAHTITWKDFEYGAKTLRVPLANDDEWTGDRAIGFTVTAADQSGVEIGTSNVVVTVKEDEVLAPGRLEISATSPAAVKGMVVDVPAGGILTLSVKRTDGSLGEISTQFAVSRGDVRASTDRLVWKNGNENAPTGVQTVSFTLPGMAAFGDNPMFTVSLEPEGAEVPPSRSRVTVRVVEPDKAAFDEIAELIETIQNGVFCQAVYLDDPRFGADAKVVVQSGSLPRGLSAEWDAEAGELTVSGTVREAGEHTVTVWLESGSTGETTLPVSFTIAAMPLAAYSELLTEPHDYRSLPVVATVDGGGRVVGSLDVSIPLSGRLSARYRRIDGKTVPFSFAGWTGVDGDGCVYAETTSIIDSRELCCGLWPSVSLRIATAADGTFDIQLFDYGYDAPIDITAQKSSPWSHSDSAEAWAGVYTISCMPTENEFNGSQPLCAGAATLTCRLTSGAAASGRMMYSGTLPNGSIFSGSSCLFRSQSILEEDAPAVLPLFTSTSATSAESADAFGALVSIYTNGVQRRTVVRQNATAVPYWLHTEQSASELSSIQMFDAFGSWHNPLENWRTLLWNSYLKRSLPILAEIGQGVAKTMVTTENETNLVVDATAENQAGITLEVNYATGQIRGTFMAKNSAGIMRQAMYQGVLTPGWLPGCDCGGGDISAEAVVKPFASGAWWWRERVSYMDGAGEEHSADVYTGATVTIDNIED